MGMLLFCKNLYGSCIYNKKEEYVQNVYLK